MAKGWAEQLCRKHVHVGRVFGRWLKRQMAKKWRRSAKADPENALIRRPTKGWSD